MNDSSSSAFWGVTLCDRHLGHIGQPLLQDTARCIACTGLYQFTDHIPQLDMIQLQFNVGSEPPEPQYLFHVHIQTDIRGEWRDEKSDQPGIRTADLRIPKRTGYQLCHRGSHTHTHTVLVQLQHKHTY